MSNSASQEMIPSHAYEISIAIMTAGKLALWPQAPPIFATSWIPGVVLGTPLLFMGLFWAVEAKTAFTTANTPLTGGPSESSKLHTTGAFEVSRNPMYLGIIIGLVGAALVTNSIWHMALPIALLMILDIYVIPKEEEQLHDRFGIQYLKYKEKVNRWL